MHRTDLQRQVAKGFAELGRSQSIILALVVGVLFVAYLFPLPFLLGHSHVFDEGDIAQHISGWRFYAQDPWQFPLLRTTSLNHPEGISIALMDGIPIAALFFKSWLSLFPSAFGKHFHYFGWWIGLVFVMQSLAATALIRSLGSKHVFGQLIAIGFAITWPVLHARYHHPALMMQCVILFALALYFVGQRHIWSSQRVSNTFIILIMLSLTIHPYFLPFTAGVYAAFLVDKALSGETWFLQLKRLTAFGVVLLLIMWLLGYTDQKSYLAGFGDFFYLNLRDPFCGGSRYIHCGIAPVFTFPYYEGFNYLGAGLLLLIPFALLLNWKILKNLPRNFSALSLLALGFFLYALSNNVHFGNSVIKVFDVPNWMHWLTGTFRASGRFFWLVSYLILFTAIASLLKAHSQRKPYWRLFIALLMLSALILQVKDVKPWLDRIQTEARKPSQLNFSEWSGVMSQVDKIMLYPTYQCADPHYQHYIWAMQLANAYDTKINTGYTARSKQNCKNDKLAADASFEPRHLYMISSAYDHQVPFSSSFTYPVALQNAMMRGECVRSTRGLVCLPGSNNLFWEKQDVLNSTISAVSNGRLWRPAELNTVIGRVTGTGIQQALAPRDQSKSGWLSYGPSVALPEGKYRFTIDYASQTQPNQTVGKWDFVLDGDITLLSGSLLGTQGTQRRIDGIVTVTKQNANKAFEIRTYFLAQGELNIFNSSLQKIPD
ncbi:MAG TPA: DUF6311 domain-containing protein [Burkholderiaceae bacterium]|nr:DUF6311 domain-containing protein [Burkholderiaceae bacterium]